MLVGDWGQLIRGYFRGLEKCAIEVCKRGSNGLGCVSGLGFFWLMKTVFCCPRGSSLMVKVDGVVSIGVLVKGVLVKKY
jgi:hypothetical protein